MQRIKRKRQQGCGRPACAGVQTKKDFTTEKQTPAP